MIEKATLIEYAGEHSTLVWVDNSGRLDFIQTETDGGMRDIIDGLDLRLPAFEWWRYSGERYHGMNGARRRTAGLAITFYEGKKVDERRERVRRFTEALKKTA